MYTDLCQSTKSDSESLHFSFDFAEKVLLPRLLVQTGQLHFVTCSKLDIFGVASTNLDSVFVFELQEALAKP